MPDNINIKSDAKQTSTLGKVRILVEQVVGSPSQAQISQAVADYIDSHPGALSPLSQATKSALLDIAEHVAYIDANGQSYYNALDAALNAKALLSITAVYTQSGTVYNTDSLDSLKTDLVVTAYYDDGTTADVTSASVLSGTLAEGTSTITVTYSEKTATFDVTVTENIPLYPFENGTHNFTSPAAQLVVSNGNTVLASLSSANNNDMHGNWSKVSANGTACNSTTNYRDGSKYFTVPAGATITVRATVKSVTKGTDTSKLSLMVVMMESGVAWTALEDLFLKDMSVGSTYEATKVAESDMDIASIGAYFGNRKSRVVASVEMEVAVYVDRARYV